MIFKSESMAAEFFDIDPQLRRILSDMEVYAYPFLPVVTSLLRTSTQQDLLVAAGQSTEKVSVHEFGRGADVRLFSDEALNDTILAFVNRKYPYDPTGKNLHQTMIRHQGTGEHFHIQCLAIFDFDADWSGRIRCDWIWKAEFKSCDGSLCAICRRFNGLWHSGCSTPSFSSSSVTVGIVGVLGSLLTVVLYFLQHKAPWSNPIVEIKEKEEKENAEFREDLVSNQELLEDRLTHLESQLDGLLRQKSRFAGRSDVQSAGESLPVREASSGPVG